MQNWMQINDMVLKGTPIVFIVKGVHAFFLLFTSTTRPKGPIRCLVLRLL